MPDKAVKLGKRRPRKERPWSSPYPTASPSHTAKGRIEAGGAEQGKLACYFYKWNPLKFPGCRDFGCPPERLADLTQHLNRHHVQPTHCPRCGQIFESENKHGQKDDHLRPESQCQIRHFDYPGLTPDQITALKKAGEIDAAGATNV